MEKVYPNVFVVGNNDRWKLMTKFQSVEYEKDEEGNIIMIEGKDKSGNIIKKPKKPIVILSHSTKGYDTGIGVVIQYSGLINGKPNSTMTSVPGVTLIPDKDGWRMVPIGCKAHKAYISTLTDGEREEFEQIKTINI